MVEQHVGQLESLIDALVTTGNTPNSEALVRIAQALAKMFDVDPDEVAILTLNSKAKYLKFVIPEKLAAVGSIPLTSATSLAARTARDRRPELVNNFGTSRHASVFEGVSLGRPRGELIHKLMSAPIVNGTVVHGVVQISRKGQSPSEAGPDFTQADLRSLITVCPVLERFLKLCPVE